MPRLSSTTRTPSARVGLVHRLIMSGRPSAIRRLVIPIVVDAIDGVIQARPFAHVVQERQEVSIPFGAYGDPASSVSRVRGVTFVSAARTHGIPRVVSGSSGVPMSIRGRLLARVFSELPLRFFR